MTGPATLAAGLGPGRPPADPGPSAPTGALAVALRQVTKVFGKGAKTVTALDGVDLQVARGEFLCVVGASGCGKSTLLNLLTGLEQPSTGEVAIQGTTGLMFQESALFPWLTAGENVELALRFRGIPRRQRPAMAADLLRTVHLDGFSAKRPHELSGGMRQRVALARAFAQDPEVLLMDEPFAALDAMTRDILHDELERLWRERNLTVVFVTHNVREAARLGDRIIVLTSRPGRVAATLDVDIPRPRRIESPAVSELAGTVTALLREEVRRHADDA